MPGLAAENAADLCFKAVQIKVNDGASVQGQNQTEQQPTYRSRAIGWRNQAAKTENCSAEDRLCSPAIIICLL